MTVLEMLCAHPRQNFTTEHAIKQEEREIIDLTLDEVELPITMQPPAPFGEQPKARAGPSSIKVENISEQSCGGLSFFAQDHTHAELPELLECMSLEELRQLAKDMKIRNTNLNVSYFSMLVPKYYVLLCAAGSNRGRADQTGILAIYFTISFGLPKIHGERTACNT